jgi:drug/metabolite transporter (DMT)-like permease
MERIIGMGFIAISAVGFGMMPLFANIAYQAGATPVSVLFLRFSIAALIMLGITIKTQEAFPRGKTLLVLVLMGAVGYAGQSLSYFTALRFAPAGLVAILLYIYPALVTGLSFIVFKHPITRVKLFTLLLSLAGIPLVIGWQSGGQLLGIALGLLAAIMYAVYIIIGAKVMQNTNAFVSSTIIVTSAGIAFGGVTIWYGLSFPATLAGWGAIFGLAFISTVVAIVMFFKGIQRIGPVDAAMLSTLEPVVAVGLAWAFMGERLTIMNLCGGLMILTAALLLARFEAAPAYAVND